MDVRAQMERIYGELRLDEIPWNLETPPRLLVDLLQSGRVAPCRAVDLGCGAGNYAVWLALRGFDVTGIDLSAVAIALAQQLARSKGAACRFIVSDLLEPTDAFDGSFDFAYDWLVLHHVFPDDRPRYVASVHRMLRPGGLYLSVCFSEDDRGIAGEGTGRYGVAGFSDTSYGVFGKSTSGYAIYSDGKAHINGNLTWQAKTSYVSVSAAAFGPVDEGYMYTNWGGTLDPKNLASRYYYAPVQLPHGATVTKIKFYWSDLSGDFNGRCYLYRNYFAPGGDTLGTVDTSGAGGTGSSETTAITNPTVDNSQYAYYLGWDLNGGGDVEGYGVVIEYTVTGPY